MLTQDDKRYLFDLLCEVENDEDHINDWIEATQEWLEWYKDKEGRDYDTKKYSLEFYPDVPVKTHYAFGYASKTKVVYVRKGSFGHWFFDTAATEVVLVEEDVHCGCSPC